MHLKSDFNVINSHTINPRNKTNDRKGSCRQQTVLIDLRRIGIENENEEDPLRHLHPTTYNRTSNLTPAAVQRQRGGCTYV